MEEPFIFDFSTELLSEASQYDQCPEDFNPKICYAQVSYMVRPELQILKQFYSGSLIYTALLHVQSSKPVNVSIKVKEAFLAFIYVTEGEVSFQMDRQAERVFVQKGKCFIIYVPAGDYSSPILPGKGTAIYFVLHTELMKRVIRDYPEFESAFHKLLNNDPEPELYPIINISKAMQHQLIKLGKYKQQNKLGVESAILELFSKLIDAQLQQLDAYHYGAGTLENAFKVYEYIRLEAFLRPLPGIEEIAAKFNISYPTLLRTFKRTFGITLHNFIIQEKMDVAQYLLAKDELSVTEVSARLGYSEPQSFSRLFKRHFGYAPSEIRDHI